MFLTYFSVKYSFPLLVVTYGLMFGLGVGMAYGTPMSCAIKVRDLSDNNILCHPEIRFKEIGQTE